MADLQPFRGWRYDVNQVGLLDDVLAPAPTVIDDALQTALYKRHACNIVRLVRPRVEIGDADVDEPRQRAAGFLRRWQRSGVLVQDEQPQIYVYEAAGSGGGGVSAAAIGCMALVPLSGLLGGEELPGDAGSANWEELVRVATVANAHLAPVVAVVAGSTAGDVLRRALTSASRESVGSDAVEHRITPIGDASVWEDVVQGLRNARLQLVAGGAYCRGISAAVEAGALPPEAAHVLTLLWPVDDAVANEPGPSILEPSSGLVLHVF